VSVTSEGQTTPAMLGCESEACSRDGINEEAGRMIEGQAGIMTEWFLECDDEIVRKACPGSGETTHGVKVKKCRGLLEIYFELK
jgi:hypothetical protein